VKGGQKDSGKMLQEKEEEESRRKCAARDGLTSSKRGINVILI
jgi:hypothetical protein